MSTKVKKRFPLIDQFRGFAIALMVFFHFFYDLNLFKFVSIDFKHNLFWWGLPRVIVFFFLLSVGMSLRLNHYPKIKWKSFSKRIGFIALCAVVISISTYFMFPTRWIFFGTLHCITICSIWALAFLPFPRLSLIVAGGLIIPSVFFKINIPWFTLQHFSMDYIPPFPWFGVVCLGIFFTASRWHEFTLPSNALLRFLQFMGRHPLKIYLAHQPILYALTYLFYMATH